MIYAAIGVMIVALVATLAVGLSKENKSENARYVKNVKKNITRLTVIYAITIVLLVVLLLYYVQ